MDIVDQSGSVRRDVDIDDVSNRHGLAWGVVGVIAQLVFTAGWVVSEAWQGPHYSLVNDTISDMQARTAPNVWFPVACFALAGIGTFCFAVFGLRPALAKAGTVAWYAPWLLACAALALGNSFPLIPCQLSNPGCTALYQANSPGGMTDSIVSGLAFLVLVIIPFPLWRRLAVEPQWRRLRPVIIGALVVGPILFVLLAVSSSQAAMPAIGLIERSLAITVVLWIGALGVNLIIESHRLSSRAHPEGGGAASAP